MFWVYQVLFLLMAAFLFGIGLRGLIKKRPLLFSARWLFGFMLLAFTPQLLIPIFFWFGRDGGVRKVETIFLIGPLMFVFLVVIFWLQMRGYFVFGVTDTSFRGAMHHALGKLGLSYEERLSAIHIPSEGLDLQVAVQSWMGTAQVKSKQGKGEQRVKELAAQMTDYFSTNNVETNMTSCVVYVVLGVFMLALVGAMSMVLNKF